MSSVRSYFYRKASVKHPIWYEYESIYALIISLCGIQPDRSKQYHNRYTVKQIKLFYDLSQSINK